MNCPWHPSKRAVTSCKDCGAEFCIECVRETDQTMLCPNCFRRKVHEIAKEFTEPDDSKDESHAAPVSVPPDEKPPPREPASTPEKVQRSAVSAAKRGSGRRWGRGGREKPASEPSGEPDVDFLSQGPDDDFSQIEAETTRTGRLSRTAKAEAQQADDAEASPDAKETPRAAEGSTDIEKEIPLTKSAVPSEDELLQNVMSTLLKQGEGAAERRVAPTREEELPEPGEQALPAKDGVRGEMKSLRTPARAGKRQSGDIGRWSFLAEPRSSEYTLIATSWWRAAIFVALMLLLGAALWAIPNTYLIPKDQEYGIHAVAIGFVLGLAFWWKAGRKHSAKLAVQASLTTFFALFIGEFLHWFLIIMKHKAFRTIFLDFVSFRFLWENGADILRHAMEAMFPIAFLWILLLPTITAFIIGFGMPPIPEVFVQIWRALKGQVPEEREASHGVEG